MYVETATVLDLFFALTCIMIKYNLTELFLLVKWPRQTHFVASVRSRQK